MSRSLDTQSRMRLRIKSPDRQRRDRPHLRAAL